MTTATTPDLFANLPAIFRESVSSAGTARYGTHLPFVQDGYVVATNGRILVRTPATMPLLPAWTEVATETVEGRRRVPRCAAVWPTPDRLAEVAAIMLGDLAKIPATAPCDRCGGKGYRECDIGHEHDCDSCDGAGHQKVQVPVDVGRLKFRSDFLRILVRAGVREIQLPTTPDRPGYFHGPGFDGLLVPLMKTEGTR